MSIVQMDAVLDRWRGEETTYIDRADEVFGSHEYVSHGESEDDGQYPGADKSLDGLLR